jgi:hypothetical protein
MSGESKNIQYEERLIAFIDILGFKDIVRRSERSPRTLKLIYDSLSFLKMRENGSKWDIQLIEIEEDAQKKNLAEFDISDRTFCSSFSDSIAVSVSYNEDNINESFSTLVANLSLVGARLMTSGVLFRGGITSGNIHAENGIIFGQGLIDAYELESNTARFPRILISEKLLKKLNYPLLSKHDRYPYHQYLKRFGDGCVGFHQMIYFEVLQNWVKMSETRLISSLEKIKSTIIKGLDSTFEIPTVYEKYVWLKSEYNQLTILNELKPKLYELNENTQGQNIHFTHTDRLNNQ